LGYHHFLPAGTTLDNVIVEEPETVKLFLTIPEEFLNSTEFDELFVMKCTEHYIETLRLHGFFQFEFFAKDPTTGTHRRLREFLPEVPQYDPATEIPEDDGTPGFLESLPDHSTQTLDAQPESRTIGIQNAFVQGALTGKHIVLNQSHGWYFDHRTNSNGVPNGWRIQRTRTWETLEDFCSAMFMNLYVAPMLSNAGATLRPVR